MWIKGRYQGTPDFIAAKVPLRLVVSATVASPQKRCFAAAVACAGIAMSTMLVYQVPTMVSLGLSAGFASAIAGLRGICQLLGRIPLTAMVSRFGSDKVLVLAMLAIAAGAILLALSAVPGAAPTFAVVAGFGIGAFSPLQGIKCHELFPADQLGATMGWYGSVLLLAGSVGPYLAGLLSQETGSRIWAVVVIIASSIAAGLFVLAAIRSD